MAFKSTGNAYCVVPTCLHSWPLYFLCFEFSEYLDESMLIPKNTSVLIHQVPGRPRVRLITAQEPRIENKVEHVQAETSNSHVALPPAAKYIEYEFGNDFYFIPDASIDTPALDWQRLHIGYECGFGNLCILYYYILQYSFVYLTRMESKTPSL
ncbi:unnamed protein product [Brassica oleracea]